MDAATRQQFSTLGEAFVYPAPGRIDLLDRGLVAMPPGAVRDRFAAFLKGVRGLSLGAWEELHTRTLDLNPPAAPYVGFQVWGESYQRGIFLASMNRALAEAGVELGGELPDHLTPVLRYLGRTDHPARQVVEALGPAVQKMIAALRDADARNPYISLLEAVAAVGETLERDGREGT